MPHISERQRVLDELAEAIAALQLYTVTQIFSNAGEELFEDDDEMDLDEEEGEQRQDDAQDALQSILAVQATIDVLQEMRRTTANRRYLEGRPVWRELAAERTTRIEGLFGCDNNWFKDTVSVSHHALSSNVADHHLCSVALITMGSCSSSTKSNTTQFSSTTRATHRLP